jgi:pimeloyl-ACP methyl ester carboxylesterase
MPDWHLSQRYSTDGGDIAWDRLGDGPAVVMVHGTPWSSRSWRRVASELAERFSVYVFDLLGFGVSEKRAGQDVSIAAHGERLARLVDFWGLDSPAVIAHDIGGAIAIRGHLLHGMAMRALVLVDVVAIGQWGSPFYRLVRAHSEVFDELPASIHEGVLRAYIKTAQVRPLAPAVEEALIAPWLGPAGQAAFYRQIAQGDERHTLEIESRYGEITAPTLVVWGEADPWIPHARGGELARRLPDARLVLLAGTGHLVQEEEPARLIRLVQDHLISPGVRPGTPAEPDLT